MDILKDLPSKGFVKKGKRENHNLTSEQRALLIRKGNLLFNQEKYDLARRIFVTTEYSDGLIRMGDLYLSRGNPVEAYRMYLMAPANEKMENLIEKMSIIIKTWLNEEK